MNVGKEVAVQMFLLFNRVNPKPVDLSIAYYNQMCIGVIWLDIVKCLHVAYESKEYWKNLTKLTHKVADIKVLCIIASEMPSVEFIVIILS